MKDILFPDKRVIYLTLLNRSILLSVDLVRLSSQLLTTWILLFTQVRKKVDLLTYMAFEIPFAVKRV